MSIEFYGQGLFADALENIEGPPPRRLAARHIAPRVKGAQGLDLFQAIEEFRSVYTSEVVLTAREQGLEVSHDYQNKEHAIPLPATLSMLLRQRIGEHEAGAKTRLYSAYPFPWREEENKDIFGDPFARDAVLSVRGNRRPSFPQIRQSGPDAFGLLELSQYPSGYPQDRLEGRRRERRS